MDPGAEISVWIPEAEAEWLEILHAHAKEAFRSGMLPSHDHSHHMRVWNLCTPGARRQQPTRRPPLEDRPADERVP